MKFKILYILLFIMFFILPASASSYTVGNNGDVWSGNATFNNTLWHGDKNIRLSPNVTDGLVSYWSFKEGSGSILNDIWGDNDAVIYGADWIDDGLNFVSANSDYANFTSVDMTNISIITRINVTTKGNTNWPRICIMPGYSLFMYQDASPHIRDLAFTSYRSTADGSWYTPEDSIQFNVTYDVATTYDSSDVIHAPVLYINGVSQSVTNLDSPSGTQLSNSGTGYVASTSTQGLLYDGMVYKLIIYNKILSPVEINYIRDNHHKTSGNITCNYTSHLGADEELKTLSFDGLVDNVRTVDIYASTNNTTWVLENSSHPANTNLDVSGNGYKYGRWKLNTTNASLTPVIYNVTGTYADSNAPSITSSSPSTPTTSFVNESKTFNAGSDQTGNWTWYIDSVLMKNTETNTKNATYINSTAPNGTVYNVTAVIISTNGSAQTSWNWTTLLNYITTNVTYYDRDNISINMIFNVSYVSPGTQQWGFNYSGTDAGHTYNWTYQNGTVIQSLTATSLNETLEYMHSVLPTGIYYIQEIVGATTMIIPANSWGMFNNWTSAVTFAGIAANESNDICYTYYNVTNGLWESYYVGYSWNDDYQLSKNASVIGYFNAQTNITSNIITPTSTELYTGWNMLGIQSSSNQTISGIIADIGTNCSDSWYFNSSTGSYSNTTIHSIQPNQGFLAYITQNMNWSRSVM